MPLPKEIDGIPQQPVDGVSLACTFSNARSARQHETQYFETLGNRAIYHGGRMANTVPRRMPWSFTNSGGNPDTDYAWKLFELKHDFSQSKNIAKSYPQKLAELKALWEQEAKANNVFPLNDSLDAAR